MMKRGFIWVGVFCLVLGAGFDAGAVFFEKKYLVRQVGGKDVLCDPYVVKKNDYVTRLLKQRGQIAQEDFPAFLALFRELNPQVNDINTIYPDQHILIPLKMLPPDSVVGQSSGTVSIPVITITTLPEILKQYSVEYKVQYGDWVSKLIAQRFGAENTESFRRGMELFKQLNPDIENVHRIREGQEIRLPEPSIRDTSLYATMFDPPAAPSENLELSPAADEKEDLMAVSPGSEPVPKSETVPDAQTVPESQAVEASSAVPEEAKIKVAEPIAPETPPTPVEAILPFSPPARGFADMSVFKKAAVILDAQILDSGEYFFPRAGQTDLRLILAETPLMVFSGGIKLLFTRQDWMSAQDRQVIETNWPGTRIVIYEMKPELRPLIEDIMPLIDPDGFENRVNFVDHGVSVAVRGQYIYNRPGSPQKICLNIIDDPAMRVPGGIRGYLKGHGITVRDWIEGNSVSAWSSEAETMGAEGAEGETVGIDQTGLIIERLSNALGYAYQKDIEISFPYAGFQVNAIINMLSFGDQEVLVDYGDLGGEAIESIGKTGFRVIQFEKGIGIQTIVERLSRIMPAEVTPDPLFWTSRRPRLYNTSLQISGHLITAKQGAHNHQVMITDHPVPTPVATYLANLGIRLIRVVE